VRAFAPPLRLLRRKRQRFRRACVCTAPAIAATTKITVLAESD
jgi:hypothetical protein